MKKLLIILLVIVFILGFGKSAYADGPYEKLPSASGVQYYTDANAVCSDDKTLTSISTKKKIDDCNKYSDPDGNPVVCANDNGVVGCYIKKSVSAPAAGGVGPNPPAHAAGSGIGYFCKDDDTAKIYHRGCSLPLNLCLFPVVGQFAYKDEPEDCDAGSVCTPATFLGIRNGAECKTTSQAPDTTGGFSICSSQPNANEDGDKNQDCFICQENTILGVRPDGSKYTQSECASDQTCQPKDPGDLISDVTCVPRTPGLSSAALCKDRFGVEFQDPRGVDWIATIFNEDNSPFSTGQLLGGVFNIFHCKNAGSNACAPNDTPNDFNKTIVSRGVSLFVPAKGSTAQISVDSWAGKSYKDVLEEVGNCGRLQVDVSTPLCTNDNGVVGGTVYNLGRNCGQATAPATPAVPQPAGGPAAASQTVNSCKGVKTWEQLDNELKGANFPGPYDHAQQELDAYNRTACPQSGPAQGAPVDSTTVTTCKGSKSWEQIDAELKGANYDGAFDHSAEELGVYNRTACPAGAPVPQSRFTTKYRLALNPTDLEKATWHDYTAGGVIVNIPSAGYFSIDTSLGTKSIYVQFMDDNLQKIKFSTGNDFMVVNIDFVDYASIAPAPADQSAAVKCTGVNVNGTATVGGTGSVSVNYSGSPATLKVYVAGNDYINKSAEQITEGWTQVKDTAATKASVSFVIPSNMVAGNHAVLVGLYDSGGSMLDGNPGDVVNPQCASSINIQSAGGGGETVTAPFTASCSVVPVSVEVNQPVTYNVAVSAEGEFIYNFLGDITERVVSNKGYIEITKPFSTPGYKSVSILVTSSSRNYTARCVAVNVRSSSSSIPAGSACSAYETTSVCGGGFATYDKCTDDKGQTGSTLCSGGASKFYCVGSTNINCDSSGGTGVGDYSCSACPNLR